VIEPVVTKTVSYLIVSDDIYIVASELVMKLSFLQEAITKNKIAMM
jgi:hypothetical protein